MRFERMNFMEKNFLNLKACEYDQPIYRIFSLERFFQVL